MAKPITFHPSQSSIARDKHRFRVLCCGRRFGKTTLAVWEMVGIALSTPGKKIAYLAPTYQQARDIAWAELKNICAPISVNINESRLEIEVRSAQPASGTPHPDDPTTSFIMLRGWEAVETLRGQKFDFLVIDEVASMRNFFTGWDEVLSPTLIDNKGSAMFISTPKGFNHFYDLFKFEAKNPDYKSFHYTTYDNPHIPKEEIERERLTKTEDAFAQEFMADFRKTEGLVYKEFDRKKHVVSPTQIPPTFVEVIAGVDFGFTHPAAVMHIGKDRDSRYFIFKEWYHRGKTDAEIAEYVAAQKFQRVYPDPENASAREELKRRGVNMRDVNKGPGSIVAGINVVRELFKSNRLYVSSDCENMILELETYSYAESKNTRDPKENPAKEFDDACFVGDTKVKGGLIKDVGFETGIKDVWEYEIGGEVIICTTTHKILTNRGLVPIDTLRYDDVIWKKNMLFATVLSSAGTRKLLSGLIGIIISALKRCLEASGRDYTAMYGESITKKKSLKDSTSIILMATPQIMKLGILSLFSVLTTLLSILGLKSIELLREKILKKQYKRLLFGLKLLKVKYVVRKLEKQMLISCSTGKWSKELVTYVNESMGQKEMDVTVSATQTAVKKHYVGRVPVYNLRTKSGMYLANGIVVSNCDAMRYALQTDSANNSSRGPSVAYSSHHGYGMQATYDKPATPQQERGAFNIATPSTHSYGSGDVWDVRQ